jgi:expansin (peptidoglycan-binding protein)
MATHAEGSFTVKTSPIASDEATAGTPIGRYALDKQFHGDLEAASKGEMLGAGNPATGTAGYVAIEHVTGTLSGHSGSFALQHFGTMEQGKFELTVKVVPGSGTGDLAGMSGLMTIIATGGKHSYTLDYALPSSEKL